MVADLMLRQLMHQKTLMMYLEVHDLCLLELWLPIPFGRWITFVEEESLLRIRYVSNSEMESKDSRESK